MKIYHFALAVFVFVMFSSVINGLGIFTNVYSHTSEVNMTVGTSELDDIKQVSGEDILSSDEYLDLNPDQGGIASFIPGFGLLIKIFDQALNIDKLILEYTPLSSQATVAPIANFFATITQLIYAVGIIEFLRKYKVS